MAPGTWAWAGFTPPAESPDKPETSFRREKGSHFSLLLPYSRSLLMIRNVTKKYVGEQPLSAQGREDVVFRLHFREGELDKRMSALEIGGFILKHLFALEPFVSHMPVVHKALLKLRQRFLTTPRSVLDEVWGWCTVEKGREDTDVVVCAPIWVEERATLVEKAMSAQPIFVPSRFDLEPV